MRERETHTQRDLFWLKTTCHSVRNTDHFVNYLSFVFTNIALRSNVMFCTLISATYNYDYSSFLIH